MEVVFLFVKNPAVVNELAKLLFYLKHDGFQITHVLDFVSVWSGKIFYYHKAEVIFFNRK